MQRRKFSMSSNIKPMDFRSKINGIINSTFCKHARAGLPCFVLPNDLRGVCGSRTRQAYDGTISSQATNKRPNASRSNA